MAYNKAREEQKWKKWKEREEEKLRELGMDEVSIQVLHESDWADFNSERRYREHQMPLLDYVEMLLAETEVSETQIQSVEELLDAIGDEQLLHILMEADRTTLQIVVLKMIWLKAGEHSREEYSKLPNNETCNAYLKEVFRFYTFMERENGQSESLKVLSDAQTIVRNSVGVRRVLNRKSFHGYLKEKGHQGKTIEQDKIVSLLQECANCRDQVLLLLLAETGFRIGELLGVRYGEDIDYKNHVIYVNFREDNENNARAKNAEFRRAKISDATFDILTFYIEEYKELILKQEYLFINVSGDYAGKPFKVSGVYAMLRRLEEKTGIKASPHMLRHYFANERRKDGWKLELISQALGHRNIETTMKYLNITDEELIQVSDEFYSKHQAMYGIQDLL